MTERSLRILLLAVLVAAAWQVGGRYMATRIALAYPTPEGVERAVGWDAKNPDLHYMLAGWYRDLPNYRDLEAARHHAEWAAELSPYSWRAQWQLGQLYELIGRNEDAERAFLQAIELNPLEGTYHWRLANLYLRTGRIEQAVGPLRRALSADRSLWRPAFGLLVKLDPGIELIDSAWPADRDSRLFLLREVTRRRSPDPQAPPRRFLHSQWDNLRVAEPPLSIAEGSFFLGHLLRTGGVEAARRDWLELARHDGLRDEAFETGANVIWNGRFELRHTGAPLDWRFTRSQDFEVRIAEGEGVYDSAGLRVDFLGSENLDFAGVRQTVLLRPDSPHELTFQARSAGLSTDQGISVEIYSLTDRKLLVRTEPVGGTTPWSQQLWTFETPVGIQTAELRLRRTKSHQIDNRIVGTYWLDNISLIAVEVGH